MFPPKTSLLDADQAKLVKTDTSGDRQKTWVTCFGFPPGQSDIVLEYFQTLPGIRIEDFQPKNDKSANWIHIKFATQKDVAVALGKNGQVIDVNSMKIMLGINLFLEGDQLDAKAKATGTSETAKTSAGIPSGGGPRRASTVLERAAAWVMDM